MDQFRYRVWQFFRALREAPDEGGMQHAREILSPPLFDLFRRMLPFEQGHAIRVLEAVEARGKTDPALLQAALLHDVGKGRYPLRPWERAVAVLLKKMLPGLAAEWGRGEPGGLRSGLVVAARHAEWGAEMAALAGAGEEVVRLIRHHQDEDHSQIPEEERRLLDLLQEVDAVS